MKQMMEEQGILVVSCVIGMAAIGIGIELFSSLAPMIETYLISMM